MHDLQPLSAQTEQLLPASFKPPCADREQTMWLFLGQTWEQQQCMLQLHLLCLLGHPLTWTCCARRWVGRITLVLHPPHYRAISQSFLGAVNPRFSSWSSLLEQQTCVWVHWDFQPSALSVGGRLQFLKPSDKMFWGNCCVLSQSVIFGVVVWRARSWI